MVDGRQVHANGKSVYVSPLPFAAGALFSSLLFSTCALKKRATIMPNPTSKGFARTLLGIFVKLVLLLKVVHDRAVQAGAYVPLRRQLGPGVPFGFLN